MKKTFLLFALTMLSFSIAFGQLSLTSTSTYTIDFDSSVSGVNNGGFSTTVSGSYLNSSPASGQLDADAWSCSQTSGSSASFPGSGTAVYATSTIPNPGTSGGLFAYNINTLTNQMIGFSPTGDLFTPGNITLKIVNNTGSTINQLAVEYLVYAYNNQPRANTVDFWYSSDNATYTNGNITFTSTAASSSSWESATKTITITGLAISNGSSYYLQWRLGDASGSGARDKFALDNIKVTATTGGASPSISVTPTTLTGFTYVFNTGPSTSQNFALTGSNLTANVSVSVTSNYQIASSAGGTWGTSLSYTPSSGSVSATVYVRQIAGLAIGTGYTGTVTCSSTGATDATVSLSGSVTSPPPPDAPEATAATNVANTSFTANWNAVSGATGYKIDVYTQVQTPTTLNEGFNGGTTAPTGWTFTNIGGTYTTSGNFGLASPSLQMDATNDAVETPTVSNPSSLSFWIKGNGTDASSALLVQGYDGTNWSTIENISNLPTTGTTKTYSSLSSSLTKFKFTYTKSSGNLAFDDVSISYTASSISYISGYQDFDASIATSLNVTGLTAGTTYYYVVRAYNDYGTSGDSNEIEVTTTNTTPTITVSTTTLSGFGYMEGSGPSAEQNFTITGSNLTANISLDAPTNYQISTGTGANFNANMADPLVLTQSGGTVGTTTIYVRLKAGLAAGDYNGEVITASSTGADNKTVTCSGTVTPIPDPEITVSATTLSSFSYMVGSGPSAEQSFTVSGTYLTANISLDAPASYEISRTSGISFSAEDPLVLTASKLDVAETTIYVRLKAGLAEGAYNGEEISITSTDAETKTLTLNGYVQTSDVPFVYWDFNDGVPGSGVNWTQPIAANYGTGSLAYTFANAVAFTGTTLNTMADDVVSGSSFVPQNGTGNVNNGEEFVMTVNTTDLENITLTYATQRTSTGFTDQSIWYSLDGGQNYTLITTFTSIASSWEVKEVDFSSVTGANDNPNFMVKIVLDGASGTQGTGNNRFDNISFFGDEEDVNPVELASFTATISAQNYITLTWVTQTETGMQGYYIFRDSDSNLAGAQMVSPLIPSANSSQMQTYVFEDTDVFETGTYYYWLQANDMDGTVGFHGPVSVFYNATGDNPTPEIPLVTELKSVYPNPFNPTAFIPFSLAEASNVSFKIYNTRGQIVKHYELGNKAAGNYRITWDGTDYLGKALSNGVYQIVMTAGDQVYQTKTTLLK